jgi:XRE family transcriptional regulator, regulator of sulfur utilization
MTIPRRDFGLVFPLLAAANARGDSKALPSAFFDYEELPAKASGDNKSRAFFNGKTHTGFPVEMHETELPAGGAPHPSHHHEHEELIVIREGILEVTIAGRSRRLGPGSVAYAASNEEHGVKNAGDTRARYWIIALGQ